MYEIDMVNFILMLQGKKGFFFTIAMGYMKFNYNIIKTGYEM